MSKARIVKRTGPDKSVEFVIQQRHFLFRWWWVDAWMNSSCGAACRDSYPTFEEAAANLCHFDGTKTVEEVVS